MTLTVNYHMRTYCWPLSTYSPMSQTRDKTFPVSKRLVFAAFCPIVQETTQKVQGENTLGETEQTNGAECQCCLNDSTTLILCFLQTHASTFKFRNAQIVCKKGAYFCPVLLVRCSLSLACQQKFLCCRPKLPTSR